MLSRVNPRLHSLSPILYLLLLTRYYTCSYISLSNYAFLVRDSSLDSLFLWKKFLRCSFSVEKFFARYFLRCLSVSSRDTRFSFFVSCALSSRFPFSLSPFVPFVTAHSAPLACLSLGLPFNLTLSSLSRRYLSFHFSSFYAGHLLRFFLAISENPLSKDWRVEFDLIHG